MKIYRCTPSLAYTYIHTYILTYLLTYTHTHIHTYIHTYIYILIHTYTYLYIYMYICTHLNILLHSYMGVSEYRGSKYSTLNSKVLIIRTPKEGTPNFRKLPYTEKMYIVTTL